MRNRIMSHVVVMQEIKLKRAAEFLRRSVLETDAVVDAGIVDEGIDPPESGGRMCNGLSTIRCRLKIDDHMMIVDAIELQFSNDSVAGCRVAIDDHRDCTFADYGT